MEEILAADKKQRRDDPWDPYWPKAKYPKMIRPSDDGTMPVDIWGKHDDPWGYKILLAYLTKYYSIKPINVKDDDHFQILKGGPRDIGPISNKPYPEPLQFKN